MKDVDEKLIGRSGQWDFIKAIQ